MRDFDAFLTTNPEDARAGKAQVLRALANVRQYVTVEGGTWSSALEAAQRDGRAGGRAPGVSRRAGRPGRADHQDRRRPGRPGAASAPMPKALAEAESAVALHARVAGEPALAFLNRSRLPAKLSEARAAVRKARIRCRRSPAMDQAIEGSATRGFTTRATPWSSSTADLAHDKELIARMTAANELIRKAVTVDTTRRPAEHEPRARAARAADEPGPALEADRGACQTRRRRRSSMRWPTGMPTRSTAIRAPRSGRFRWVWRRLSCRSRSPARRRSWRSTRGTTSWSGSTRGPARSTGGWRLGEPAGDPPLVLGNQLFQVLPSGKLLVIALESGELESTVNLGRPLARSPVHDEAGQHLYVLGRQDCLFVLTREPLVVHRGRLSRSCRCVDPVCTGAAGPVPGDPRKRLAVQQPLAYPGSRRGRGEGQAGAGGGRFRLDLADAGERGPIVWGRATRGDTRRSRVGDYASKVAVSLAGPADRRSVGIGPGVRPGAVGSRALGGVGAFGAIRPRPRAGKIDAKAPIVQPGPRWRRFRWRESSWS